jgi:hypothetical protein
VGLLVGGIVASVLSAPGGSSAAPPRPTYRIEGAVDLAARRISGTVLVTVANPRRDAEGRLYFHLYPNRFHGDGEEVNDITRPYVYPEGAFDPGGIRVGQVHRVGPGMASARVTDEPGLPEQTILTVDLEPALPPGGSVTIAIEFVTQVPERYGPFGVAEAGLTALGGWYPYLAAHDQNGWHLDAPPEAGDYAASLAIDPGLTTVLGDAVFPSGHAATVAAGAAGLRNFALVLLRDARLHTTSLSGVEVTFVTPILRHTQRVAPGATPEETLESTVGSALEQVPPGLARPHTLTVVAVPLRWNLTSPSDGLVVVSDRTLHVFPVLHGFHAAQVAKAVYAELVRPLVLAREQVADRYWLTEGIAWVLADRFVRTTRPEHRDVYDWTSQLDFFAIVDRFETAPKIPYVQAFFRNAEREDELREGIFTYAAHRAAPRLSFARLEQSLGAEVVGRAVDEYLTTSGERFADALAHASGRPPQAVASQLAAVQATSASSSAAGPTVDTALLGEEARSPGQIVFDSADVEVSSSEFGFSALIVARRRHDYQRDIAVSPFYSDRAVGVNAGPRFHWGEQNDPTLYRHNLYAFYTFEALDRSFKDDRHPDVRTTGQATGLGLRYDYSNLYAFDNPTNQREARIFADWFDTGLGGDWSFVRWGARAEGSTVLLTPRTIVAGELLAGFEEPLDNRGVPVQEQFSLGGRRALRGIPVNDRLARNIGLARGEIRQEIYPDWDLNLLDILTYRRPQLALFVDTGQVDDSAGRALNPEHFAIGGGVGFNAVYDFLGFFPGRAYIEVATRFDRRQDRLQVLFGTRQAF